MGEAARRRSAAFTQGPWPGGSSRCPQCFGLKVKCDPFSVGAPFYGRLIAICGPCGIAWEPIDEATIYDREDPQCSGREPCDNCAFRPGSPEQADKEKWKETIFNLREGGRFYCHKGVPIDPKSSDGFAYPERMTVALGHEIKVKDTAKMRLCRGYLNALGKWWDADAKARAVRKREAAI